jgi:hypothetical protein
MMLNRLIELIAVGSLHPTLDGHPRAVAICLFIEGKIWDIQLVKTNASIVRESRGTFSLEHQIKSECCGHVKELDGCAEAAYSSKHDILRSSGQARILKSWLTLEGRLAWTRKVYKFSFNPYSD